MAWLDDRNRGETLLRNYEQKLRARSQCPLFADRSNQYAAAARHVHGVDRSFQHSQWAGRRSGSARAQIKAVESIIAGDEQNLRLVESVFRAGEASP